jgi:hypothetical protein
MVCAKPSLTMAAQRHFPKPVVFLDDLVRSREGEMGECEKY